MVQASLEVEAMESSQEPPRPFRVLVIDDEPPILSQVRHILARQGYEILTAASGRAGLALFQQQSPDLVIVDLELGDTSGLELLAQMKRERPYLPVVALSTASEVSVIAALRQGADDYLSKPIVPEEMVERVVHNLEKGRQARVQAGWLEQLQRDVAALASVREVARAAGRAVDLYQLLQRTLDQTLRAMRLDAGILFMSDDSELIPLVHRGLPQAIAAALARRRLSWDDPALRPFQRVTGAILTTGQSEHGGPLSQSTSYAFSAVVPLWHQGRRWGMLEVAAEARRGDPDRDLEILGTVGQQFALTLANVRWHEAAQLRLRKLAVLNEASLALTSETDLDQMLATIMMRINDVVGVEAGFLLLAEGESGELVFRLILGGKTADLPMRRISPGKGIAGWVHMHGRSLLVSDVAHDPRYDPQVDSYAEVRPRSVLCAPLLLRGSSIGVIELVNKIEGEFGEDDQRLLESIAALIATGIERVRLQESALMDPRTGLPGQRFVLRALEQEIARCQRYERRGSLLLLGVDPALSLSDAQWRGLGALLKRVVRHADLPGSYRPGVLATILPETDEEGARALASRLLEEIQRSELQAPDSLLLADRVRCVWLSFCGDVRDPQALLARAEEALAQAWQVRA
ncbi:MAG: GAF domain-containing protein [Chloroflexia bacterium]